MRRGAAEEKRDQKLAEKLRKPKDKLDQLIDIVGLKQEQTLIKYLFYPFWKAVVATTALLTGVLLANGSWVLSGGTIAMVCFSYYMYRKLRARLKILNSVLGIW